MAQPNTPAFLKKVTTKENTSKELTAISNPARVGIHGKKSKPTAC